jgi:FtsH-binding integral membrane protein
MSMYPDSGAGRKPWELEYSTDDRVISKFFNVVYAWMAVGLAVTAAVAWFASQSNVMLHVMYGSRGGYAVFGLSAFAIAMLVQSAGPRINANLATALFLVYAAIIGLLLCGIFVVYPSSVLAASFLVTGGTFAGMSVYGFVTKRDLSRVGSILIMAAWGLFIASWVNFAFFRGDAFSWLITYGVLIVFTGLVAYETQKLKEIAVQFGNDPVLAPRYAIVGSLWLYVDFINIFISILRILGNRK